MTLMLLYKKKTNQIKEQKKIENNHHTMLTDRESIDFSVPFYHNTDCCEGKRSNTSIFVRLCPRVERSSVYISVS